MNTSFWSGFEKRAGVVRNAVDAGKAIAGKAVDSAKGIAKNVVSDAAEHTVDYSKMTHQAEKLPVWKQKMMAKGKTPVGVGQDQVPRGNAAPKPNPSAAPAPINPDHEELLRRRKSLAAGATPHSAWQDAMKAKPQGTT